MSRRSRNSDTKREDQGTQSRLADLFTGKNLLITALVTAVIGVAVPKGFDIVEQRFSSPIQISAAHVPEDEVAYVLPQTLSVEQVSVLPAESASTKLRGKDAVTAGDQQVALVVRGNSSSTVAITNIRARVLNVQPAINGTLVYMPFEGGESSVQLGIELGVGDHSVQDVTSDGEFVGRHFAETVYTVKNDEVISFKIQVHATNGTYVWDFAIDAVVDGDSRTFYAGSESRPFRVSSLSSTYGAVVGHGETVFNTDGSITGYLTAEPGDQYCLRDRHLTRGHMCKDLPR